MYEEERSPWVLRILVSILVVGIVAALGAAYYFYNQNRQAQATKTTNEAQEAEYIAKVSALVVVPSDEKAVVARVDDASKFDDQQFFSMAQNGDVFVIYPKAKRAYLYRPSANKIVDVGPVDSKSNPAQSSTSATPN